MASTSEDEDLLFSEDSATYRVQEKESGWTISTPHWEKLQDLKDGKVNLSDVISPKIINDILSYFETREINITEDNVFDFLYAAVTLRLEHLEHECSEFLLDVISPFNIGELAKQALYFKSKELLKNCVEYFGVNTKRIIESKGFLDIPQNVLSKLCGSERFDCKEVILFKACIKWSEAKCRTKEIENTSENIRNTLNDVIHQIPFSSMNLEDFEKIVIPTDILTTEEVQRIKHDIKANSCDNNETSTSQTDPTKKECLPTSSNSSNIEVILSCWSDLTLHLSPLTTIGQMKKMKIWDSGRKSFNPKLFTLGVFKDDKELSDDIVLSSIEKTDEYIHIEPFSITVTITDESKLWSFPFTLNLNDFWQRSLLISQAVQTRLRIKFDNISLNEPVIWWPGDVISVSPGSVIKSSNSSCPSSFSFKNVSEEPYGGTV